MAKWQGNRFVSGRSGVRSPLPAVFIIFYFYYLFYFLFIINFFENSQKEEGSDSLVVMTSALHAEGREFNPRSEQLFFLYSRLAVLAEWLRRMLKAHVRKSVGSIPTDCNFFFFKFILFYLIKFFILFLFLSVLFQCAL